MIKIDVCKSDLYAFIKDKSYHRMTDKNHVVTLLQKKFSNPIEELYYILEEAIDSENIGKIQELDTKYQYTGTISSLYKVLK